MAPDLSAIFALQAEGKLDAAADAYRALIAAHPDHALLHAGYGELEFRRGKLAAALPALRAAARLDASSFAAQATLGQALLGACRHGDAFDAHMLDEAIGALTQARALRPDKPTTHLHLGQALHLGRRFADAIAAFSEAIRLNPNNATVYQNLGVALSDSAQFREAIAAFEAALARKPDFAEAALGLGTALFHAGAVEAAAAALRRALALRPDYHEAYCNLIFVNTFGGLLPPDDLLALARGYGPACVPPGTFPAFRTRAIATDRRLRIGILSAEIGRHAVASFLLPYLRHYDRTRFSVTLYPTSLRQDDMRATMMALADRTVDLFALDDHAARARLIADDVDLLIDTTSFTAGSRLRLLAARCAPIQCHYIGFTATTGLDAVDYVIGDDEITPRAFEAHFCERIARLPVPWMVYEPPEAAPEPEPKSDPGGLVLGSFNNLAKARSETLALWGAILNGLPGAQLVLKDRLCADAATRERILAGLAAHGVNAARVTFIARVPDWAEHMRLYNTIDIALDTAPLSSATTAYDALLMGTPVVALRGGYSAGRMTSAILRGLGRSEWIGENASDCLRIVRTLAADKAGLRAVKRTLRAEMLASPLCDGAALARHLEALFAEMVARHNAAQAA